MISHPGPCLSTSKLFTKCADLIKVGWAQQTRCCQIYCYRRHCFSHRQTCHSRQSPPQPKRCLWCKKMSDLRELPELSFIPIIITLIIFFVEKQQEHDLTHQEPRVMCAGYLSSPYAESEYMDCMRNTMDYSKYINTNTNTNDICRNAIRIDRPPTNN